MANDASRVDVGDEQSVNGENDMFPEDDHATEEVDTAQIAKKMRI